MVGTTWFADLRRFFGSCAWRFWLKAGEAARRVLDDMHLYELRTQSSRAFEPSLASSESRLDRLGAETVIRRRPGTHLLQRGTSLE